MTAKKTSEIHYKIMLRDICEKIDKEESLFKSLALVNERCLLITNASLEYPHINWMNNASYELTELQSIAKIIPINLN